MCASLLGDNAMQLIKLIPVYLSKMPWLRDRFASQTWDQQINLNLADSDYGNCWINHVPIICPINVICDLDKMQHFFL